MMFLTLVSLLGCERVYKKYMLNTGETVTCEFYFVRNCGLDLFNCTNGRKYECMVNVTELDPNEPEPTE